MMFLSVQEVFEFIVKAGRGVKSDGHIEFPMGGRFTVVEIPENEEEREQMKLAVFPDSTEEAARRTFDDLREGWYYVALFSDGRVSYRLCKDKTQALKRFRLVQESFQRWEED